jgi:hypothetical protein
MLELINFQNVPPPPAHAFYHFLIFLLAYFNESQLAFIISFRSMRFLTAKLCVWMCECEKVDDEKFFVRS